MIKSDDFNHSHIIHKLKILLQDFEQAITGIKNFEQINDNGDYQVNDLLVLKEWDPDTEGFTGREAARRIRHVPKNVPCLNSEYAILDIEENQSDMPDNQDPGESVMSESIELCIARLLLSAYQNGRVVLTISLITRIRHEQYSMYDLISALYSLEKLNYIRSSHDCWIITKKGIDHFFRSGDR